MGRRTVGDRVADAPRKEMDRRDLDAVMIGGVLTDARAPERKGGIQEGKQIPQVSSIPSGSGDTVTVETDGTWVISGSTQTVGYVTINVAPWVPAGAKAIILNAQVYGTLTASLGGVIMNLRSPGDGGQAFELRAEHSQASVGTVLSNQSLAIIALDQNLEIEVNVSVNNCGSVVYLAGLAGYIQ